jgi:hypothetical protein
VTTGAADAIGQTTATLHGTVNPNGLATGYHFEYGLDAGALTVYTSTPTQSAGSGTSAVPVSADLGGLAAGTTYRYRLVASSSSGTSTGDEATFKTAAPSPPPPPPVPEATAPVQRLVRGTRLGTETVPVRFGWTVSEGEDFATPIESSLQRRKRTGSDWGDWSTVVGPAPATSAAVSLAASARYRQFRVLAEDQAEQVGIGPGGPAFRVLASQESSAGIAYGGIWQRVAAERAYGGAVRYSTRQGATATLAFSGRNAAVVMPLRAGLGTVRICLDPGTARQSCAGVDLSPDIGLGARRIVFARNGLAASLAHRLRLTVLGGRADLDAFVVLG